MSAKGELVMMLARTISFAYPPIVTVDAEGAINVDTNRLAEAILLAGYRLTEDLEVGN